MGERRFLLLSDIPPCTNYSGGLFVDQLVRSFPHGEAHTMFCVMNRMLDPHPPKDSQLTIVLAEKPQEFHPRVTRFDGIKAFRDNRRVERSILPGLIEKAVQLGRKIKATDVWAMLEGQTMIRMALPIARALNVPIYTHIMDPPGWWLRSHGLTLWDRNRVVRTFHRTLAASTAVGTASPTMAQHFRSKHPNNYIAPILPAIDEAICPPVSPRLHGEQELRLAVAGQLYADDAWRSLIAALDAAEWRIGSRSISLNVYSEAVDRVLYERPQIKFINQLSQAELIRRLAEEDVLYCPYWFDPAFETEARLCFPSKLSSYLAAGRAVLFHGPAYCSPAQFLIGTKAGELCHSMERPDIMRALTRLCDETHYAELCANGHQAFIRHLALAKNVEAFRLLLSARTVPHYHPR